MNNIFTRTKFGLILVLLAALLMPATQANAQCANNNVIYTDLTPTGVGSINSAYVNNMYGGEYCTVSVCEGATYSFSTCGSSYDTQITLYEPFGSFYLGYDDDDGCGLGSSYLEWTADYTGVVWVLLDEYNCISNLTNTPMEVTQLTSCPSSCTAFNTDAFYVSCTTTSEDAVFYIDYTGACSVDGMWFYSTVNGWEYVDLSLQNLGSGDAIYITFFQDNTAYDYSFVLSNGDEILGGTYITGNCNTTCTPFNTDGFYVDCGTTYEDAVFYIDYTGSCLIDGMWFYSTINGWEYVDLSLQNLGSGDPIYITFYNDNTSYDYSFVLSNGIEYTGSTYITGDCFQSCSAYNTDAFYVDCTSTSEDAVFYVDYTGACSVDGMWFYSTANGWEYVDLSIDGITSGDPIYITFFQDNTEYDYSFILSNGDEVIGGTYITGDCNSGCSVYNTDAFYVDCFGDQEDVVFYVDYTGLCDVSGMWFYSTELGWEYVDLQFDGIGSGDPIYITFGLPNTAYTYSFVLSDGSETTGGTYYTGSCGSCSVTDVIVTDEYCQGDAAIVTFVPFISGGCSAYSMWSSIDGGLNFSELILAGGPFYDGDPIQLQLNYPGTQYVFYWQLSDGSLSTYYYFTPEECSTQTCFNLDIEYTNTGCQETGIGLSPSAIITPFFTGGCSVSGLWISVNGDAFTYLDLSGSNYGSGDDIGLWVYQQDAIYEIYYVLDDGTVSPSVSFITDVCESGETICDCAGTQLPVEALDWQGDGVLDDGSFFWNDDPNLPVDFNCATWGFDCGDELPDGTFAYDPYGTCSGALPPANGCVDEFCYSIDIDVYTDCYPEEVSLYVYNANNDLVMEVPVLSYTGLSEQLVTLNLCLPAGCYTFYIFDDFGDGLNGEGCNIIGYFGIWDWSLNQYVGVVEGDQYTEFASIEYCVGPQTECSNLEMTLSTNDCYPSGDVLLPSMAMEFSFAGNCTVETIYLSENGGPFEPLDVSGFGWGSGDIGAIYYMQPNTSYEVYYVTDDGATSYLYSWTTADCNNEVTICDCDGTQLSIGVTDWLGDGFADNGFYTWAGQYVNFNCSTWGYDCGDIDGSPTFDPYNVCEGGLPPFNGCIEDQPVLGCTDPDAINYNPAAEINDGSCIYDIQIGCTDPDACNYNEFAVIDNGTCEFVTCAGCTDDNATNYDPTATIDDGSCIYFEIEGCTDPNALNYDATATQDDGSCIYDCVWPQVAYDAHCTQGDLDNFYIDVDLNTLGNGAPYTITNSYNNQQQVMSLLGELTMGPFPNGTQVVIQVTSNNIDCLITSQPLSSDCSAGGVYGCTDPTALNYNPNATIDDGSCVYIGVEEMESGEFGLYPNPAKDIVTLTSTAQTGVVQIHILDAAGRIILETQAILGSGANATLELGDLAQGNYVIELITEGQIEHLPLMIQK